MHPAIRRTGIRKGATGSWEGEGIEDSYGHVGMDHLTAIGDASASLGLISTLVFSICIGSMMQLPTDSPHEFLHLFLALAAAFSTYTTTYSLLEYYYVQTLKGVDNFMKNRLVSIPGMEPSTDGQDAELGEYKNLLTSTRGVAGVVGDRARLVYVVETSFSTFNDMRMWARNCMWLGLMCLNGAAITKLDPLQDQYQSSFLELTSSGKTAIFFSLILGCLLVAFMTGFRSLDLKAFAFLSLLGLVSCTAAAYSPQVGSLRTARFAASFFLAASILTVPITVKNFRGTFLPMAKKHTHIH
jgi:hypothetical protein